MQRSRFTDQQLAFALQQAEQGTQVGEVTRKMGISEQTFYRWKKKFEGLIPSAANRTPDAIAKAQKSNQPNYSGPAAGIKLAAGSAGERPAR